MDTNNESLRIEAPDDLISGLLCVLYAGTIRLGAQELYTLGAAPDCIQLIAPPGAALRLTRGSDSFRANCGELLAVRGGQLLTLMPDAPTAVRLLTLRGACADAFLPAGSDTICYSGGAALTEPVFAAISENGSAEEASVSAYRLLLALHRLNAASPARRGNLPPVVESALGIMREQFAFLGSIAELAEQLGVTQEYLTRAFSAAMGITPGKYLLRLRIEYAKLLLRQGGHTVGFVSEACGFTNANYFARVFRGVTGQNPGDYRLSAPPASPSETLPEPLPDTLYIL